MGMHMFGHFIRHMHMQVVGRTGGTGGTGEVLGVWVCGTEKQWIHSWNS